MDPKNIKKQFWGPAYWTILHTLANSVLTTKSTILQSDEAEAWVLLLKIQQYVMPCALCSKHYGDWLRLHNLNFIRTLKNEERAEKIQSWLFDLHENVNQLNNIPSSITRLDLKEKYPSRRLNDEYALCCDMFRLALERRLLKLDDIHRWKTAFARLRALYGV